jgi:hypothetical protein
MKVIGKWIKTPLCWSVTPPSIDAGNPFGSLKIDSSDGKQQIELIFNNLSEVKRTRERLEQLEEILTSKINDDDVINMIELESTNIPEANRNLDILKKIRDGFNS